MFLRLLALSFGFLCAYPTSSFAEDPKFAHLKTKDLPTTTAPDLHGGVIFTAGAFDLSSSPSAMIFAEVKPPQGPKFLHSAVAYRGEYTDTNTNIVGYLYHLKAPTYERYFLISKLAIPGGAANTRYVVDFSVDGVPLRYFTGAFEARP